MPIQFRCGKCRKLLAVATRKAGGKVECPKCKEPIEVPEKSENHVSAEEKPVSIFDDFDVDELLSPDAKGRSLEKKLNSHSDRSPAVKLKEVRPQKSVAVKSPEDRLVRKRNPFPDPLGSGTDVKELPRLAAVAESDEDVDVVPVQEKRTTVAPKIPSGSVLLVLNSGRILVLTLLFLVMLAGAFVAGFWMGKS